VKTIIDINAGISAGFCQKAPRKGFFYYVDFYSIPESAYMSQIYDMNCAAFTRSLRAAPIVLSADQEEENNET